MHLYVSCLFCCCFHVFSWPSKAMKHIKYLKHLTGGKSSRAHYENLQSTWRCQGLAFGPTEHHWICICANAHQELSLMSMSQIHKDKMELVFMGWWLVPEVWQTLNHIFIAVFKSGLVHSVSFQHSFSWLFCPLHLLALPTPAFYDCRSNHIKNLVIIPSQGRQSNDTYTQWKESISLQHFTA